MLTRERWRFLGELGAVLLLFAVVIGWTFIGYGLGLR